jgi:hypothetical protein
VTFPEVIATVQHSMGLDVNSVTDLTSRPPDLVDDGAQPLRELA